MWETTFIQQANTKNKNVRLRSVSENKADYTYLLFPTDRYADNYGTVGCIASLAVRPALHLNLKSVVEAATPKPFDVTVGDTTTGYSTIVEAWTAANEAGTATVKMNAAATITETLVVNSGANITLDLHNWR